MEKRGLNELFASEALRGERIHWKINWIMYPVFFMLSFMTYRFQNNVTAGAVGMGLAGFNLLYNGILGYFIVKKRSLRILSYLTITLLILSVAVYNYFDAAYNSPVLAATSALILIYPVIIFLASMRMDRILVIYSTILSCIIMDLQYFQFHSEFHLSIPETAVSADFYSLMFRNIFLLILGYMIYTVPKSMYRILLKQESLMKEKTFHQTKAERDPLTSLYNRYFLETYFAGLTENGEQKGERYALLYIDLNDFKIMNDTYGHDFGDFVLKSVGEDLNRAVRGDDIVARIGGDELVVLFLLASESMKIEMLAERISKAIGSPRTFNDITISVKASIGVSIYPDHAETLDELLKKADQAMYKIKKQKKHGIAYA